MSDVAATAAVTAPNAQPASQSSGPQSSGLGRSMWSHGSFSFKDVLDIVNPLQHLPVVGSVYRYLTGDEPAVGTRVIGDALYGGPIGFGVSVVSNALLTNDSGQDLGERLLADVFGPRDHGDSPTLGTPQVVAADDQPAPPAAMPAWMATAGTPDGQPRTPAPANLQSTSTRIAAVTPPTKPMGYAPARSAAALPARSIASAAAPMSSAKPAAPPTLSSAPLSSAPQPSAPSSPAPQGLAAMPAHPVAMDQLFRSAPPASATPEQAFMAQASQFQRQISQGRGTNGAVLNNHPVPLELSSNLLPVMPAGGHLTLGPASPTQPGQANIPATATASQAQAAKPAAATPGQNAIAQKMLDALNKYEQLKKQEHQQDNAEQADKAKLDLAL